MITELYVNVLFPLPNETWLHQLDNTITNLDNGLRRLHERIVDAIDSVTELAEAWQGMKVTNAEIGLLPVLESHMPATTETEPNPLLAANGYGNNAPAAAYTADIPAAGGHNEEKQSSIGSMLGAVGKFAESTEKVATALEEHSIKTGKLKGVAGIVGGLSEGAAGIDRLVSPNSGPMTTADGINTAAQLIEGGLAVAEAALLFGAPGLVVAGGALATVAVLSMMQDKKEGPEAEASKPTRLHDFVMTEREAGSYMKGVAELAKRDQHLWEMPVPKPDPAYNFSPPLPLAKQDNQAGKQYMLPNYAKEQTPDSIIATKPIPLATVEERLRSLAMSGGRAGYNEEHEKLILYAKKYDAEHGSNTLKNVQSVSAKVLDSLLREANAGRVITAAPTESTPKARTAIQGRMAAQPATKPIQINLNRPMIEHFTVIAKDAASGLGDFKRQVEEVLLEILQSANAIN